MARPAFPPEPTPQQVLERKRHGGALSADEIAAFVRGLANGGVGDAQAGAFAMAVCCRGMDARETAALTLAMRDSGDRLEWQAEALPGPVVDKHSTGGLGDATSLLLGPLLAACGCHVPMVSGRALGHTGGTLDKLEAIPGYDVHPTRATLRQVVREVGVAIVGAGPGLAPADQRLYAVRDLTATVDALPLITASILAKKLAAGLQALVLDVKYGNGAFLADPAAAATLARSLVEVAGEAGLPADALLTAMDQPLAPVAGNALEVADVLARLRGAPPDEAASAPAADRFTLVTLALGSRLLLRCGLAGDVAEAESRLRQAWRGGAAAERFARMVAALGGPHDLLDQPERHLPSAPVCRDIAAPPGSGGHVQAIDVRGLGAVVVALGGGRRRAGDHIDPSVGLEALAAIGPLAPGQPLARVHAATPADADAAAAAVQACYRFGPSPVAAAPLFGARLEATPSVTPSSTTIPPGP